MGKHYGLEAETASLGFTGNPTATVITSKDVIELREEIGYRIASRTIIGVELTGGELHLASSMSRRSTWMMGQ